MYNPQLKIFVAVADCGSFTKAAESLFITPPAVMKQINALEKHLDLKLLERTPQARGRGSDLQGREIPL